METQPVADDAEQQWIAKYRRAIESNPSVPHTHSAHVAKHMIRRFGKILSSVGRIFDRSFRSRRENAEATIDITPRHPEAVSFGRTIGRSTGQKAS